MFPSSLRPRAGRPPRTTVYLATAAGAAAAMLACRSDAVTAASPTTAAARLQVVNAARTPVDVLVDGTVRVSALPAASVSPVLAIAEGGRRVEVRPVGATAGTAGAAAQVTGRAASLALVAAQAAAGGALAAAALDDTAPIPAPGTSKLRVLHLAPNAAAAGVWVLAPAQASLSANASCYGSVIPWKYAGSTSYFQSAPGSWEVVITPNVALGAVTCGSAAGPTGTANDTTPKGPAGGSQDPHAYAIARLAVPLAANQARTVVMLDAPGGGLRLEQTGAP